MTLQQIRDRAVPIEVADTYASFKNLEEVQANLISDKGDSISGLDALSCELKRDDGGRKTYIALLRLHPAGSGWGTRRRRILSLLPNRSG